MQLRRRGRGLKEMQIALLGRHAVQTAEFDSSEKQSMFAACEAEVMLPQLTLGGLRTIQVLDRGSGALGNSWTLLLSDGSELTAGRVRGGWSGIQGEVAAQPPLGLASAQPFRHALVPGWRRGEFVAS